MLPVDSPPLGMMIDLLSGDDGVEYLYFGHSAGKSLRFDIVADTIGLEEQYQHSSGKVLEGAAQCHTDGDADRCEYGQE